MQRSEKISNQKLVTAPVSKFWFRMKKRLFPLLLALAILFGTGACSNQNIESTLADDYLLALCNMKFEDAYSFFWKYSNPPKKDEFVSDYQAVVDALGITSISVKESKIDFEDQYVTLHYTLSYACERGFTLENKCTARLFSDNRGTFLEYSPSLILPDFEHGDTVRIQTLSGKRGEILTEDHVVVASNDYSETVMIRVSGNLDISASIRALSERFDLTEKQAQKIKKDYDIALEMNYGTVAAHVLPKGTLSTEDETDLEQIAGVYVDRDSVTPQRYYPYKEIFCHIVGYTGAPNEDELATLKEQGFANATLVGKAGLEKSYDQVLQGKDGFRVILMNADGQAKSTLYEKPAENGQDLVLTLNSKTQQRAYYLMQSQLPSSQKGVSIVLDPKTGFVESIVSSPSYDPNLFSFSMTDEQYAALTSEESGNPLFFRATQGLYPPGSLLKPFSVTPALEKGVISPTDVFPYKVVDGEWTPEGVWYWPPITRSEEPDGPLDLNRAIRFSDNIYFSWVALQLGDQDFMDYMRRIGLGESIPFDIPTAKSNLINQNTEMTRRLLTDMSYGHGEILVTPLQMASMYTAFQNDGNALVPKVVKATYQSDGNQISEAQTEVFKTGIMKTETISTLIPSLKDVVTSGTASRIQIDGLTLAAKTGTALKGEADNKTQKISWICGWWQDMPEDRLALVVIEASRYDNDQKQYIVRELLKSRD